jgi:putative FmdB family regulatory protein
MIGGAMPIYDYRCDHCGHAFSQVQSFSDPPVEKCPNCGKRPRRLIVPPAIVFKGSGWYKTDSRGPDKSETKSESKSDEKSGEKPPAKADTKAADAKTSDKSSPKSEAAS